MNLLTVNALAAADSLLVPVQCEYYALEGVSELFNTLARLRRVVNPQLKIEGLLLTMYDERTNLAPAVAAGPEEFLQWSRSSKRQFPGMFGWPRAPSHGKPVIYYDEKSRGAEAYSLLAKGGSGQ